MRLNIKNRRQDDSGIILSLFLMNSFPKISPVAPFPSSVREKEAFG
jgi:hypothetical protein